MRFTERELTEAAKGAAMAVLSTRKDVRRGKVDVDEAWRSMSGADRYHFSAPISEQVLAVLVALPDVDVEPGTRPSFTDEQVKSTVEAQMGEGPKGRVRRLAVVTARTQLVKAALAAVPVRQDPDSFQVPDHL